jgi:hypothetical protein
LFTSDNKTGTIFFFKLESSTQPTIVKKNVGTVNYEKGEILLNPVNIVASEKFVDGNALIQISAIPKSNDVIGLQDLYLQLDINKTNINIKPDRISSGYDISGTNYVVSSSYTNGTLIR